eukprot:5027096-Amphidinium_carterae.1
MSNDLIRDLLRQEHVRLCDPPYTPPADNALESLATRYAEALQLDAAAVLSSLEEWRLRAVANLKAKSMVSLCGKLSGGHSQGEIKAEFDVADTGASVRLALCAQLGVAELKIVAGGKILSDDSSLQAQGWKPDKDRGGKPLHVLLFGRGSSAGASADAAGFKSVAGEAAVGEQTEQ